MALRRISYAVGTLALTSSLHLVACTSAQKSAAMEPRPALLAIGHRGAAGYAPENTISSFEEAKRLGLTDVELDIQLSKDKVLVLFHDETLDKKTQLKGPVRTYTWKQLSKAEIGTWFDRENLSRGRQFRGTTLTTLKAVFEKFQSNFRYHVEIKASDVEIPERALALFKEMNVESHVLITSFYFDQLTRTRQLDSGITLCYLIDDRKTPDLQAEFLRAKNAGIQQVAIRGGVATKELTTFAHSHGLSIRGWGIKDESDMKRAIAAGLEGMTLDWPDRLAKAEAEVDSETQTH